MKDAPPFTHALAFLATLAISAVVRGDLPANTINVGPPQPGGTEKIVRVLAPQAYSVAVSEVASVVVAGVAPKGEDAALVVYTLDAAGATAKPEPVRVTLAKPPSLAAFKAVPTGLCAHPRLPLLYVWQDVLPADGTTTVAPAEVVHRDFDHLLIYRINGGNLELVKSTARGAAYSYGFSVATLVTDATAEARPDDRLYLPSLQKPNPDNPQSPYLPLFGYVTLNDAGMPAESDGGLALTSWTDLANFAHIDHPIGIVPISKDIVIFGGYLQMASLELRGLGQFLFLNCDGSHFLRTVGHPALPRVYSVGVNTPYVYTAEHVDGLFTMLPQRATVNSLYVQSHPVVDAKGNQLVVGSNAGVHLLPLDAQGLVTGVQHFLPTGHVVRALTYSAKFDRIYVPVEKLE